MNAYAPSRWTMPLLRAGMGLFLAAWGLDKLMATDGSIGIFSAFYGVDVGALAIQVFGIAEILLGILLAVGLFRVPTAWIQLLVNGVSTVASWGRSSIRGAYSGSPTAAPTSSSRRS